MSQAEREVVLRTTQQCRQELREKGASFGWEIAKSACEIWLKGKDAWVILTWGGGGAEIFDRRRVAKCANCESGQHPLDSCPSDCVDRYYGIRNHE